MDLKEVIKEIKPSVEEKAKIKTKIDDFLVKLNKELKDAKAILGGSGAKDTWLRGVNDADVFVLYDYKKYKDKSDKLSEILEPVLKKRFRISKLHGSRDYFQVKQKNFTFEVIPILNIKNADQALNITDISPLHAKFVAKYKKLVDDIRLMKQFCKAHNCYGAESYIKGFSGYACEVLVINYGSFMNLIRKAAKWKPKVVVDIKHFYRNKDPLMEMNASKTQSPLLLIDPVQKERNVTAALSEEKFNVFVNACKRFLKKPSKKSFEEKKLDINAIKKKSKGKRLILLEVQPLKGKVDIVGSKLLKALEFLSAELKKKEFKITDSGWDWDKKQDALFWIITNDLGKYELWEGPPLRLEGHVNAFRKKYKNWFVKKGKVYAKIKRKYVKAEDLIKSLVKTDYVKEKVKAVKWIR